MERAYIIMHSCSLPTHSPSGAITRLSTRALHAELVRFGCDVTGDIAVRRARLKRAVRNLKARALADDATADEADDATAAKDPDVKALRGIWRDLAAADASPRYICVVDFECTCEENMTDFPHEIIEFPMVGYFFAMFEAIQRATFASPISLSFGTASRPHRVRRR